MYSRKSIRKELISILKNNAQIDVKNIYSSRPNPLLLTELPACLVYYTDDTAEAWTGGESSPSSYKRNLQINIDIVADSADEKTDDFLDDQMTKIELTLFAFSTLNGKSFGLKLNSVKPYTIDIGSDKTIWASSSSWVIPYETEAYLDMKNPIFEQFNVKINREDYNDDTTDPTLIEAEKNF